jgi:hypothetical protein
LLEAAVEAYGPTHRKEHVKQALDDKRAQFWFHPEAAIVTEIKVWPTGFREVVGWLAGGSLDGVLALIPQIETWARGIGCERAIINGRYGWKRRLPAGYRVHGTTFVKDFTHG